MSDPNSPDDLVPISVDREELAEVLDSDDSNLGARLDLETGAVWPLWLDVEREVEGDEDRPRLFVRP